MHIGLNKSVIKAGDAFVGGQNSWELGGGNGVFKDYLGKSDKIDGNWV